MCIGALQNIRGLKYRNHRPDLIICDDMEDMTSFQDRKQIQLFHDWFMGEIWSIGSEKTNIVVLGNLLHPRSIMISLYKGIKHKHIPGIFKAYPLLDDCNRILWPARYPDAKAIKELERSVPGVDSTKLFTVFSREYLLDMSLVTIDYFMEEKHAKPISAKGKKASDFEISAPMWGMGIIDYIPGHDHHDFHMSFDDPDGYNFAPWMPIEKAYIEMKMLKDKNFKYKYERNESEKYVYENMVDFPDVPLRHRYWYKGEKFVQDSKPSEMEKLGKPFGSEYAEQIKKIKKAIKDKGPDSNSSE